MAVDESPSATTRTVRFHEYGEPVEVLRLAEFPRMAAEGRLAVPIARTFALDEWGSIASRSRAPDLSFGRKVVKSAADSA